MRLIVAVVLSVIACGNGSSDKPTPERRSAAGSDAAVVTTIADAAVLVDLFRAVPLSVEVSSRVANAKIKLEHLVDRDLGTAWNSRTGELEGSWLSIHIPQGVVVHQVRMTVGHTGKGPKGEDYFTMNHRITRVTVKLEGKPLVTQELDPNVRDLQTIALPLLARGGTLMIEIDKTVPGTKPRWVEACISELELWGTAEKTTPNAKPRVFETPSSIADRLCKGKIKDTYYPECQVFVAVTDLPKPWAGVGVQDLVTWRSEHHGHLYGETIERSLVLIADEKVWTSDVVNTSNLDDPGDGTTKTDHSELAIDEVKATKNSVQIRYEVTSGDQSTYQVVTCSLDQTCSAPVDVKPGRWR